MTPAGSRPRYPYPPADPTRRLRRPDGLVPAAILADPGRVLELTDREAVTGHDIAAIRTGLSGCDVRFQPLTDEIIEAGMARAGLPPEAIGCS